MDELIQKLQDIHGLSAEQSKSILNTITDYVKEKFPMIGGAVDNLFQSGNSTSGATSATSNVNMAAQNEGALLDKISDFIPGATGEKIEEFSKDKLSGLFGGNKKI